MMLYMSYIGSLILCGVNTPPTALNLTGEYIFRPRAHEDTWEDFSSANTKGP